MWRVAHSQWGCREAGGLAYVAGDTILCFHELGRYFGSTHQEIYKCSYPFIYSCEWIPKKIIPRKETIICLKQFIAIAGLQEQPHNWSPSLPKVTYQHLPPPPLMLCTYSSQHLTTKGKYLICLFVCSLSIQLLIEGKLHKSRDFPAVTQGLGQHLAHSQCSIITHQIDQSIDQSISFSKANGNDLNTLK